MKIETLQRVFIILLMTYTLFLSNQINHYKNQVETLKKELANCKLICGEDVPCIPLYGHAKADDFEDDPSASTWRYDENLSN